MELFVFLLIAAVGAAWYWNHSVQKKLRQEQQDKADSQAPYKIESVAEPAPRSEPVTLPETVPTKTARKPAASKKSAVVKTTGQAKAKKTTKPNKTAKPR